MQKKKTGFTLIELIVVITILAILGTIGFISYSGYTRGARNAARISDMKTIGRAFSLYITKESQYPLPDNPVTITYSGGLAWTQGTFSNDVILKLGRVSNIPKDPYYKNEYSYAVNTSQNKYQIASVSEGGLFSSAPSIIPETYAISTTENIWSYVLGDYLGNDIKITHALGDCSIISSPSILLSEIPVGQNMVDGGGYGFVYQRSPHLPASYSGYILSNTTPSTFQISEVLSSCSISSLIELELYMAKLATAFQPFAQYDKYEDLIYNSNTTEAKLGAIENLKEHGIEIEQSVIDELNNPLPTRTFIDTFTDSDGLELTTSHTPNSLGSSWGLVTGSNSSAYTIQNNRLQKNDSSLTYIYPITFPAISTPDYGVGFDVIDFSAGTISIYLRYTDNNNYYKIDMTPTGYQIIRRITGFDATIQNISDPIANGSSLKFTVAGDSLIFTVDDIEKENIVVGGINAIGNPVILLENTNTQIDNFTLSYK